jgi:hypothetical protein
MIDTICLLIPKDKITMLDAQQYGVPTWDLHSKADQYEKYVKNPSKRDLDSGLYFPRLTGYKRKGYGQEANVRIEFSVPKLLFLNNLDELEEKDFPKVIDLLQVRLKAMGLVVPKQVLESASVSSVHFSRNLKLDDGYTASHLISEMNKVNLRKTFDFARARYINDGESLYAHATSHQLVIYDKVADLGKDKKRAIDKDQPLYQRNLFQELQKEEMLEIIRFEVRLSQKQKMNKVLEDLGYKKNPTFKDVFKEEIAQKVVQDYWKRLIKERSLGIFSISMSQKDILRTMYLAEPKLKPKQAIYYLGLSVLAKDENGMRELRSIIEKKSPARTWYRIADDLKEASTLITKNKVRDWVTQIDKKLEIYKPFKKKDYEKDVKEASN